MGSSRIPLLSVDAAKAAAADVGIIDLKAQSSLYRVLLCQPQLAKRVNDLIETLMTEAAFDPRLRELIVMRIGWTNDGVYEWTQHWRLAPMFGVDERDLLATRDWEVYDHWTPTERAVLRATDESLATGVIAPETWNECVRLFPSDRERLELVAIIGAWRMMSDVLRSLEVPLEDGVEPWPPDGVSPSEYGRAMPKPTGANR